MAKSNKEKGLVLGGALLGLLLGGSAMGVTGDVTTDAGKYFKFNELKSGYQLAAAEEEGEEGEDEEGTEEEKEKEGDKSCKGDKGCGEASCG